MIALSIERFNASVLKSYSIGCMYVRLVRRESIGGIKIVMILCKIVILECSTYQL